MDVRRIGGPGVLAAVMGALVAALLGLLTFGAQATAGPRGLPLAVAVPAGPAGQSLAPILERLTEQGGDAVSWRMTDPASARALLEDAEVYGVLELAAGADGRPVPSVVVSGAVNPSGTQVAQHVLTAAGQGLADALAAQSGAPAAAVRVETVHPVSAAGRTMPLAASALLWLGGLVTSAVVVVLGRRDGSSPSTVNRLVAVVLAAVLGPAVVLGFAYLWDPAISVPGSAVGFLVLTAAAFALLQAAVLRLVGLAGMALLAPLYLVAPAVTAQVPELLDPAYRVLLWSWSPFRFSAEALRSLLAGTSAPAVDAGIAVLTGLAVAGLVALVWPARRPSGVAAAGREPVPVG